MPFDRSSFPLDVKCGHGRPGTPVPASARLTILGRRRGRSRRHPVGGPDIRLVVQGEAMQRFLCMPRLRNIDDAQVLKAMAHPLRLRLLGSLRKDGPATASELGRRLGESSGATSYHLRILEKYGFVEDHAERNRGRERWWRAVDEGVEWSLDTDDPGLIEADRALGHQLVSEHERWLRRWHDELPEWDR